MNKKIHALTRRLLMPSYSNGRLTEAATRDDLHDAADVIERLYTAVRELQKLVDRMIDSDLEVHKARKERADAREKILNCPPPESWLRALEETSQ